MGLLPRKTRARARLVAKEFHLDIVLRKLTSADEAAFLEGVKQWDANSLFWYTFDWKPGGSYAKMLEALENSSKGIDLLPHHVPSTMLYGFIGDAIVGRLHVRHVLNEALTRRGGNCGYAVAPAFRGQKFATQMMAQGIAFCRDELKLKKILITCADSNIPSWKIIENFGGRLENTFLDDDDQSLIRRYWMEL